MTEKPARILIIAGSDSGGGAGIQADIKTVTALGGYAMTAVTAITVQDTTGVHGVHAVPESIVRDQIMRVLDDIGADAIKTGMLGGAAIVEAVVGVLRRKGLPIVVDPVMIAKGGGKLLADDAVAAVIRLLVPLATVITPNASEAAALTGAKVETVEDLVQAGKSLLARGAKAALVKGGHLKGDTITDALVTKEGAHLFRSARIQTTSTHGTGCTLASAIAAGLAQGFLLEDAIARARAFVQAALRTAPGFGHGHGPMNHMHAIPPYEE
ncbi:MAG: bifunctional hydroxymethylpyrimidine kinase/phosphomethylpyrimidine kinase [Alphaproteobacteria bacterium]